MKVTLVKERKQKPDFNNLGFGKYFTDHMLVMEYDDAKGGWSEPEIIPFDDFLNILKKYGETTLLEQDYNTYRGSRNLNTRNIKVKELLWILKKKD